MKTILIKCGGSVLDSLTSEFFSSLKSLIKNNYNIVFVHGGGPDINQMLEALNVNSEFVDGLRKTDKKTMEIVEMILSGKTNRKLVEKLTKNRLKAIGINGSDANIFQADYVNKEKLGCVGEIISVQSDIIQNILQQDLIPVITPIALAMDGQKLNINADYAAAAVANELKVDHCIFVTDVDGIKINGEIQTELSVSEIENYINCGEIYGGMIPKVHSALSALEKGIESVMVVSGKKCFFTNNEWKGTKISGKERVKG